jgi:hypothetical protein
MVLDSLLQIHKRFPPISVLSQIGVVHVLSHVLKIHFNIIFLTTPESSNSSSSLTFHYHNSIYISHLPIRATCPTHLRIIYLVTRITFGEDRRASDLC